MKYLIASDLHGSNFYLQKLKQAFNKEKADLLIFLGDIYNHGPRNQLPEDYSPMQVADTLNQMVDKMVVIKGNCDSEVDTMISNFDFISDLCLVAGGKKFFLTHGHVYNKDKMPKTNYDGIIYGHFHTGFIEKIDGKIIANAGSLSLPKNNTKNSYLVLDDKALVLKDLEGNTIDKIKI